MKVLVLHEMNLSCTLHDPDPKLNLNHFCRSQEQAPRLPACRKYSSSLDAPPTASGVRPIQRHLQVAISCSRCKADAVAAALPRRPAQSDRGDEQLQGRAPPTVDRAPLHSSPRSDAAAPLWPGRRRGSSAATVLVLWSGRGR